MQLHGWKSTLVAFGLGLSAQGARAATVAVIDSGLDVDQKELAASIWLNPVDSTVNGVDEDNNGYTDDVHGWNFAENKLDLIDKSYANLYSADVVRYFAIQTRSLKGKAPATDTAWAKEKLKDKDFLANLMTYGNYAHGTHVSGIIARQGDGVKVLGIKLIPTKNPLQKSVEDVRAARLAGKDINFILKGIIKAALSGFAGLQGQAFQPIGQYVATEKAEVVNGSFGVGAAQARAIITPLIKQALGGDDPTPEQVDEFVVDFLKDVVKAQKVLVDSAPDTLFVFAAGNDKSDNDILPAAPASIESPRVISVAAAFDDGRLAPFSNFGANSVDLAAPGVGIESTVPDDHRLQLSGTSQAAPQVAGTAAAVKTLNPALSAEDVKKVVLGTVDVLPELQGKVKTSGFLNNARAKAAATLSKTEDLDTAIAEALRSVPNAAVPSLESLGQPSTDLFTDLQPHFLGKK